MSGVQVAAGGAGARTTAARRLGALGRSELRLLGRNKSALFVSLVMPIAMAFAMRQAVGQMPLKDTGLTVGTVLLPGAVGFVLLFAVYSNLTSAFVVRREELVLKRLRTGELTDLEVLAGTALPTVVIALAQCVLLAACGGLLLDARPPQAPLLVLAGVVIGVLTVVALAAASAGITRTAESAQLTVMPLMFLSMAGSGLIVPLEVLPERLASALELLPLTPTVGLLRDGWTGGADAGETLRRLVVGMVWIGLGVLAVRRGFRWEPRR